MDADGQGAQDLGDLRQQAGPVRADQGHARAPGGFLIAEFDLRGHVEVALGAAGVALRRPELQRLPHQCLAQPGGDLAVALPVFAAPAALQHPEGVQAHALARGQYARFDHVQVKPVQGGGDGGEQPVQVRAVDEDLACAAAAFGTHGDHRQHLVAGVDHLRGDPGDLARTVTQETGWREIIPDCGGSGRVDAFGGEHFKRLLTAFKDPLVRRDRVLQTAADGEPGRGVQVGDQACLPGVP